jgi:hypothetical protein
MPSALVGGVTVGSEVVAPNACRTLKPDPSLPILKTVPLPFDPPARATP